MPRLSRSALALLSFSVACATSPAATPATSAPAAAVPATQSAPPAAQMPARPAALNPVGTYDFTATLPDGSAATGNFTITGSAGAWTGTISRDGEGTPTELTNISVDGQTLTANTVIPDGALTFTMNFSGAEFTGKWAIQGAEGAFNGKRR